MRAVPGLTRTLGPLVVRWVEANLVHGPGDVQGQAITLDDEMTRFLLCAYELDDQGRRVVNRAVFSRLKGRAKSEFEGMIVCAEALGPVRFAGWDHDGKPLGRAVTSPFIPCVSTEEGQATDNVYGVVEFMLKEGPISRLDGLDVGLTRTFLPGGGKIQPITAKASSKDGGKETFAAFDETHLFVTPDLIRLHATIRRNLTKRRAAEPWSLEVTTMFAVDQGSVAEASHHYAERIADGSLKDRGFLYDYRGGPSGFDWEDDDQLRASVVEAAGVASEWMDIERIVNEIRDPQTSEADARRYYLNQPSSKAESWLDMNAWAACKAADREGWPADGTEIVAGFDGSYNNDSTALVGCTLTGHVFVIKAWERPDGARDWIVPRDAVDAEVAGMMRRWKLRELRADPNGWHSEVSRWSDAYGSPPVVTFEPAKRVAMSAACSRFYSAVLAGDLSHDGHPRLAAHLAHAVVKETSEGAYITKDGRNSPRKIDLAIAAVLAYDGAMQAPAPQHPPMFAFV